MTRMYYGIVEKPELGLKIIFMSEWIEPIYQKIYDWKLKDNKCNFTISNDEFVYELNDISLHTEIIDLDE